MPRGGFDGQFIITRRPPEWLTPAQAFVLAVQEQRGDRAGAARAYRACAGLISQAPDLFAAAFFTSAADDLEGLIRSGP